MRKLKTEIYCDTCGDVIFRKDTETWKEVLNKADWKWCSSCDGSIHAKINCASCTHYFEIRHNIDPKTGMKIK